MDRIGLRVIPRWDSGCKLRERVCPAGRISMGTRLLAHPRPHPKMGIVPLLERGAARRTAALGFLPLLVFPSHQP